MQTPQWLQEQEVNLVFIRTGGVAAHAYGENTTWYSYALYADPESEAREHFEKKFSPLDEIGYKELIPKFTAEDFGAYYTHIVTIDRFEKYSRTGDYANIIFDLGRENGKFFFGKGSSCLPY